MSNFMANLVPFFAFLWALSLVLFNKTLYESYYQGEAKQKLIVPIIIVAIAAFEQIIPIRTIINKCLDKRDEDVVQVTYDQCLMKFPTDYERENPVTKNEAFLKFLD